jgi:Cdc6-like AAA superfamily ATPase
MAGSVRNYYAGGNTAKGFHSLCDDCLKDLQKVFILQGAPGTGKSTFMKKIGEYWVNRNYQVEYLHCPLDTSSIDGVIIVELKVGIVNGSGSYAITPRALGAIEEYINLGEAWDSAKLAEQKDQIMKLSMLAGNATQKAYERFAEALSIHDNWEKIYIEAMDFQKADDLTRKLIFQFYGNMTLNKESTVKHRFLGAATPDGAVDYVPNLTEDVAKRYFIKGRPGSGKSTMLRKIAEEAQIRGLDVEVYHCGFDPNSLDMVIVRELGIAIFDSTAPHEYFPSRDGDEIVDMYGSVIASGTDEIFEEEINNHKTAYRNMMDQATGLLKESSEYNRELEGIYKDAMDFEKVNEQTERVQDMIHQLEEI